MNGPPPGAGFTPEDRKRVARGIATTLVGKVAEASQGVYLFVSRYLYGGVQFGLFIIAHNLVELLARFLVGGFGDAVTYFGGRYAHGAENEDADATRRRERALYRAVATCIQVPLVLSLVAVAVVYAITEPLYYAVWEEHDHNLVDCVRVLAWVLPLAVLVRLPVDAVKAYLDMKWAVIVGDTLLPLLNLGLAVVLWALGFDALGLAWGAVFAHAACIPVAWYGYTRHYKLRPTLPALFRRPDGEVLGFAFPQSVNMMFGFGLTRVDALMLSGWVSANLVGVYALVGELTRTIRAAKTSFSSVFAPLAAKYKAQKNQAGLVDALHAITRWTSALSIPLLFAIMAFYPEVILAPGTPWPHGQAFPWMTALAPMMSCFFGLAGNLLLMTGHSRLLLLNSGVMMGVNVALNALFIPRWGLVGAALATMIASFIMSLAQLWQMWHFEGIKLSASLFTKTLLSAGLGVVPVVLVNVPAVHAVLYGLGVGWGLTLKILIVLASIGVYAAALFGWPGDNPEREWLHRRMRRVVRTSPKT